MEVLVLRCEEAYRRYGALCQQMRRLVDSLSELAEREEAS